jgi:hypothetical protein
MSSSSYFKLLKRGELENSSVVTDPEALIEALIKAVDDEKKPDEQCEEENKANKPQLPVAKRIYVDSPGRSKTTGRSYGLHYAGVSAFFEQSMKYSNPSSTHVKRVEGFHGCYCKGNFICTKLLVHDGDEEENAEDSIETVTSPILSSDDEMM